MPSLLDNPNFWSAISALGGAISAIAALATVWQARKTAAEERQAARPYFTVEAPGFKKLESSGTMRLIFSLKNVGSRRAAKVKGRIVITPKTGNLESILDQKFTIANAVPPNVPTPWYKDSIQLPMECPAHYVLLGIEYVDPATERCHRQAFYLRWDGVQLGATQPDFVHATEYEQSDIMARFGSIIQTYESEA